ncbi:MAG: copper transporter [Actinomycetota bacterium]
MINLRYHVVTLMAVFLALGLGVLFGASFIDQSTVTALKISQQRLSERNKALRDRVVSLERESDSLKSFAASTRDALIREVLLGRSVVLVAFESSDEDSVNAAADALVKAGGSVEGSIRLSGDVQLESLESRRRVASLLGSESSSANRLFDLLVARLAEALSGKQPGFIKSLVDGGLATVQEVAGGKLRPLEELATVDGAVVIVPAGQSTINRRVAVPLARALSQSESKTAVVERGSEDLALVGAVRKQGVTVVTVDGIEGPIGQAGLALGLKAAFEGAFGHYGTGEGASAVLPEPRPPGEG